MFSGLQFDILKSIINANGQCSLIFAREGLLLGIKKGLSILQGIVIVAERTTQGAWRMAHGTIIGTWHSQNAQVGGELGQAG